MGRTWDLYNEMMVSGSQYGANVLYMYPRTRLALEQVISICLVQFRSDEIQTPRYLKVTRTTHAHDASRRSKRHARMGRAAQVSGVARLESKEQYKTTVT